MVRNAAGVGCPAVGGPRAALVFARSERDVVGLGVQGRLRSRGRGRCAFALLRLALTRTGLLAASAPEELQVFADDLELRALLARLLVVPGVQVQPALDEDRPA